MSEINSFPINGKQINEYNLATPAPQDLILFSKEGVVKQAPINDILPSQTSNSGKVLTTNGTVAAWQTPNTGSVTSVAFSGGSTGLSSTGGPITSSGTITLDGTLNIANGGTGQTTANSAFNALAPSQISNNGKVLTTNGTNTSWLALPTGGDILFSSSDYVNTNCQVDTIGTAITLISKTINFAVSNTITLDFDLGIFNNSTANRTYTFIISLGSFTYDHVVTVSSAPNAAAVRFKHKITSDATWTFGVGTCIQVPSGAAYGVTSGASALEVKAIGSPDYGAKTLSVKCYSSATTATQAIELISYQIRKSEDI